jgi:processive 1,2-diacylglycerol beta-glucosyltransferase
LQRLSKFLRRGSRHVIVSTHFLPAEMIASLRRREQLDTPQLTVTTDFESHRMWVNQPCEHYFAATNESAVYLRHWGVPEKDVTVSGIPVHPAFAATRDRGELRKKFQCDGDNRPIVLQLAGGFGVGPVEQLHQALLSLETPIRLFTVSGRNEELKARLEQRERPERHAVSVLGYRTDMPELMTLADVVVSKPGGLTTAESLACGTAIVIVNPIPGQESRNSDYLLENGAGIKINAVATLPFKLGTLLADRERLERLRANARRIARPHAAEDIAAAALEWAGRRGTLV